MNDRTFSLGPIDSTSLKLEKNLLIHAALGEDFAEWLRTKLIGRGLAVREPYQEDWGWELPTKYGTEAYYLCLSGNSDESSTNKDEGEWRIIVEKKRTIGQRLRGAGKITTDDRMIKMVEEILSAEPAIRKVHREE